MDVSVKYCLAGCIPAVHTDVKSVWLELAFEEVLHFPDEIKGISVFLNRHVPDRFDVAPWNYEGMTRRSRKRIRKSKR